MLSTNLHWILSVVLAICAVWAAFSAYWSRSHALRCVEWMDLNNKRAVTLKKLSSIETELTDMRDALDQYGANLKKLRSRSSMRKLREEQANGSDEPDPRTQPDEWKRWKRAQLHIQQISGSK